jgi:glutathione S-transferase
MGIACRQVAGQPGGTTLAFRLRSPPISRGAPHGQSRPDDQQQELRRLGPAWLADGALAGLDFTEKVISPDDPAMKAEMLLLSASMLVPSLQHNGIKVWDTLAIGEYLNEIKPKAAVAGRHQGRAHCRAICGEMHSGFASMRGSPCR